MSDLMGSRHEALVRAVVFDVGGVLLTLGEWEYRREIARRMGLDDLPVEYEKSVPLLQRGEMAEEELWFRIAGKPVAGNAFDDAWLAHFPPVPEMLALGQELRRLGVRTAILSNTQTSHVRLMRRMGFLEGFEPVAFSCEIGYRKPEAGAFRWVLERLGLPGEAVAYVDDVPEYVKAASELGIHAILHRGDLEATRRAVVGFVRGMRSAG